MKFIYYSLIFILVTLTSCSNAFKINDPIPKHDSLTIVSKFVNETRRINIWTPPNYNQTTDSLPILYMPDGGLKEDFPHIANTLDTLIKQNKIPPYILVGIENTVRRRDLSGPSKVEYDLKHFPEPGGAENFRGFIKNELFPIIDKKYRTSGKKAIIGESAAGLFVIETFMLAPDMFDNYIAFDPSIWWNNHYLVRTAKEHLASFPKTEKRIWFAGSSAEDISQYTNDLAKIFKAEDISNVKWKYSPEPKEKHNTIFRATKEKAIKWTLGKQ